MKKRTDPAMLLTKGKELFENMASPKPVSMILFKHAELPKDLFINSFLPKKNFFMSFYKNRRNHQSINRRAFTAEPLPERLISSFLHMAYQLADENPLLQQWFQHGEAEVSGEKYPNICRKIFRQIMIKRELLLFRL
jgi:hypothetical protein